MENQKNERVLVYEDEEYEEEEDWDGEDY